MLEYARGDSEPSDSQGAVGLLSPRDPGDAGLEELAYGGLGGGKICFVRWEWC